MPNPDYASLLKKKADLLLSYKTATERGRDCLNETDNRAFAACMKERNRLIHKIVLTDRLLMPEGPYRMIETTGEAGGGRMIESLFKEVESLLTAIKEIEDDCMRSAQACLKTIKEDILTARQNRRGAKGYQSKIAAPARFVDTQIR